MLHSFWLHSEAHNFHLQTTQKACGFWRSAILFSRMLSFDNIFNLITDPVGFPLTKRGPLMSFNFVPKELETCQFVPVAELSQNFEVWDSIFVK